MRRHRAARRRLGARLLTASLVAPTCLLLASCRSDVGDAAAPRNILLLSIDTLRADHLGCYGYARDTSPNLDALAARGVLFEQVVSPAPWTMPAHASLLSGVYPRHHGVRAFGQPLPARLSTLASALGAAGYRTAAVVNFAPLAPLVESFEESWTVRPGQGDAEAVFEIASRWLAQEPSPFFLFLHVYDVHLPHPPRSPFLEPYDGVVTGGALQVQAFRRGELALDADDARHLRDLYDGEIRRLDEKLGRFLEALERDGRLERTLVAVVADHGEEFFEHGSLGHGHSLHPELLRVPLILAGPTLPRGLRVQAPVSLLDTAPTLLTLVGVPPLTGSDGVDLSSHWGAPDGARPLFSETNHWLGNRDRNLRRAVRRGRYALHYDALSASYALFDLREDPFEEVDVSARHPRVTAELRRLLEPTIPARRRAPAPAVPPELTEELRQLGYGPE
jgi:arylsulfatase A-like enzyme